MKCKSCGAENPMQANFCRSCGKPFTQEQQEAAYEKTIFGKLDALKKLKGWVDFSNITGNLYVRLAILAVLLVLVAVNIHRNGTRLAIQGSNAYTIAYNEAQKEYYLLTEESSVAVHFSVPRKTDTLRVENVFPDNMDTVDVDPQAGITLPRRDDGYYVLKAQYTDGKQEALLFFVCEGDPK